MLEAMAWAIGFGFQEVQAIGFNTGAGTVLDFSTPQHIVYLYRSVAGIHRLNTFSR